MTNNPSVTVEHGGQTYGAETGLEESQVLLTRLCDLLAAALPLAIDQLRAGGVTPSEQRTFWRAFLDVETWLEDGESEFAEMMADYVEDRDVKSATFYDFAASIRRKAADR